jgi:uncharacterized protein involved in response to NO
MMRGTVQETEASFRATSGALWRREPFRVFFPLGVVLGWVGVSHWLLYFSGLISTYSCMLHGLIQTQAFMMAFALGFLLTALPRRTQTPPASAVELCLFAVALVVTTIGAYGEAWRVSESAYAFQFLLLLQFAVRRFLGRAAGRRPPAAFVLIPIGLFQGLLGAFLIVRSLSAAAPLWAESLGRLLISQGVFLSLVAGVGSLILPLMAGQPPPPDLDASPAEKRKLLGYAAVGVTIFASFWLEQFGWTSGGPLLRAGAVALATGLGGGAWRWPAKAGLHRRLVWLALWLLPCGLVLSALFPALRVALLHITFIGGFGMLAYGVATHVALSHLDMQAHALGRPRAVMMLGAFFLLAMLTRVVADFSDAYFLHLAVAASLWLIGSAIWLVFLGPRLLRGA